jgi:hypothetical protein
MMMGEYLFMCANMLNFAETRTCLCSALFGLVLGSDLRNGQLKWYLTLQLIKWYYRRVFRKRKKLFFGPSYACWYAAGDMPLRLSSVRLNMASLLSYKNQCYYIKGLGF